MTAYVDDSGSDRTGLEFVLGGVMMPQESWDDWCVEWAACLASSPFVEYFKGSEVWERRTDRGTPFCLLTDGQRRAKVDALVSMTIAYRPRHFSVRMKWSNFKRFQQDYLLTESMNNPYFWLYYGMIALSMRTINRDEANPTPIEFVFDHQNKIGESAKRFYAIFKSMCSPEIVAVMGREPEFGDEKMVLPLQAADLFAWYRRREAIGSLNGDWHNRIYQVLDQFHVSSVMEEDHMAAIARSFGVMKKA